MTTYFNSNIFERSIVFLVNMELHHDGKDGALALVLVVGTSITVVFGVSTSSFPLRHDLNSKLGMEETG